MASVVNDILGGPSASGSASRNFQPIGIRAGGLTGKLTRLPGETRTVSTPRPGVGGLSKLGTSVPDRTQTITERGPQVIDITASPERQELVSGVRDLFSQQADEIAGVRERFAPGMGELTQARLASVEDARRRAVGNLRENLSRRRVLGSSFGQDAINRAESEFAREEQQARARSKLEELEIESRLIDREFSSRQQAVQTSVDELNLQADLASQLATGATNALQRNAQAQAQLAQQQASGMGELIGTGLGLLFG